MQRKRPSLTERDLVKRRQIMAPLQDAVDPDIPVTASSNTFTSPVGRIDTGSRIDSPVSMHPSLSASLNSSQSSPYTTPPPAQIKRQAHRDTVSPPTSHPAITSSHRPPAPPPSVSAALAAVQLASTPFRDSNTPTPTQTPFAGNGFEPPPPPRSGRASPPGFLHIPKMPPMAQVALSAMQYLPTPLLILSTLKTVIFANDAMGKLLGLDQIHHVAPGDVNPADRLIGQSLGQIGIDLLQDGQPVWVNWERFLDGLTRRSNDRLASSHGAGTGPIEVNEDIKQLARESSVEPGSDDAMSEHPPKRKRLNVEDEDDNNDDETRPQDRSFVQDTVVDVLLSSQYVGSSASGSREPKTLMPFRHVQAKMVISIWSMDGQQFYSLAFSAASASAMSSSRSQIRMTAARTPTASNSPSSSGSLRGPLGAPRCAHCGGPGDIAAVATPLPRTSPSEQPLSIAPFPLSQVTSAPTVLQRTLKLKDAIINGMQIPKFAMWKDESLVVPNKAAEQLMRRHVDPTSEETLDPLSRFQAYSDDFSRKLDPEENPIVRLCRSQKPFKSMKVGYIDKKGRRVVYDVTGECLYDDNGEFIGGITALKDVTEFADKIREQTHRNEQQFELICDCMPQIAWTTTPTGGHDWFSKRWYEYTGLTWEQSSGEQWANVFHPEDMPETERRWRHSLATGDEYVTEYRAKSATGEWRWMLGRALPLKNPRTGEIVKWFGTCTDIHDLIEARQEQKRTHEQLINVIDHAKVTVWSIDRRKILTFLEGPLHFMPDKDRVASKQLIGHRIEDAFGQRAGSYDLRKYVDPIDKILKGQLGEHVVEHHIEGTDRWFRTRFVPIRGLRRPNGKLDNAWVDGVVGVSQDVSEVKLREMELHNTEKENIRLTSAETAAKEASRLKSQFLANMSHEIRTPIAGVIGMADLLFDTPLNDDQRDLAENIQRSANGLLTVINDILDLSKVESGRLEIESVQFNLSVVLRDVGKMMSFAAGQKGLVFDEDFRLGRMEDLILIGDPNRCRQILMNLLTNSIKFTSDGAVKLAAWVQAETSETTSITFAVEDTGQGIEEAVQKKLFKPFTQADSSTARRFGGTGLGLTICKNLVDLMKGTISLTSVLGQGTTAKFTIPFTKPQVTDKHRPLVDLGFMPDRFSNDISMSARGSSDHGTPPHTPSDQAKPGSMNFKRLSAASAAHDMSSVLPVQERQDVHVLVVEDNAINQQIATRTIKKLGFSVHAVDNGKQALEYILKSAHAGDDSAQFPHSSEVRKPSVILMDVQMPVLDGYRATHQIRHHDPFKSLPGMKNVPIVAMTASAIQGDKEKCERAGMDDYLAKPVRSSVLEQMLVKWAVRNKKGQTVNTSGNISRAPTLASQSEHDSNCTETDHILSSIPAFNQPSVVLSPRPQQHEPQQQEGHLHPSHLRNSKSAAPASFPSVMSPPPESEGDRGLRRQAAEEKAQALRDEKLVSAAESDEDGKRPRLVRAQPSGRVRSPSRIEALTEENLGNMNREHEHSEYDGDPELQSPRALDSLEDDIMVDAPQVDGTRGKQAEEEKAAKRSGKGLARPDIREYESGSSSDSLRTNSGFVRVGSNVPSEKQGLPGTPGQDSSGDIRERMKIARLDSTMSERTVTPRESEPR